MHITTISAVLRCLYEHPLVQLEPEVLKSTPMKLPKQK